MNKEYCKYIEDHLYSFYRKAANHGGLTVKNFSEFSVVSGIPGTWPNHCFNLRVNEDKIPAFSRFIVSEMKLQRIPPLVVVGNSVNQVLVNESFLQENMRIVMQWSGMAAPVKGKYELPEIAGLKIELVRNTQDLDTYLHLISTQLMQNRVPERKAFEKFISDPAITMYLTFLNGEPVGTALLYINNDVAGIYMVTVQEAMRGKGIGKALTATIMNEASRKSCKLAILHATIDGERVYRKFEFEEYGKINIYSLEGNELI